MLPHLGSPGVVAIGNQPIEYNHGRRDSTISLKEVQQLGKRYQLEVRIEPPYGLEWRRFVDQNACAASTARPRQDDDLALSRIEPREVLEFYDVRVVNRFDAEPPG